MSKIFELKNKIHSLIEIQSILGAMKNLAIIEINKIGKLSDAGSKGVMTVRTALADFEKFYPHQHIQDLSRRKIICILLGSERGFCGPFNERIVNRFSQAAKENDFAKVIVIGQKLATKITPLSAVDTVINGPNSTEDIATVIDELIHTLFLFTHDRWMFIANAFSNEESIKVSAYFPLEVNIPTESKYLLSSAPIINMRPEKLYPQIREQYLFMVIHQAFFSSFLSENRERLMHMEGAIKHLENSIAKLSLKYKQVRQELITEEIEILLLSTFEDTKTELI